MAAIQALFGTHSEFTKEKQEYVVLGGSLHDTKHFIHLSIAGGPVLFC
jgi:hypothetical protein